MSDRRVTRSEAETASVGRDLAGRIAAGTAILLYGDLGAGKTAFVRGLAEGLEIDPSEVSSPTFTLVQEYRGRLSLQHVDLYRLRSEEVNDLGLEELAADGAVLAIEWADRLAELPTSQVILVTIGDLGADVREILIEKATPRDNSALPG